MYFQVDSHRFGFKCQLAIFSTYCIGCDSKISPGLVNAVKEKWQDRILDLHSTVSEVASPCFIIWHPTWRYCGRESDWVTRVWPDSLEAGYHSSPLHTCKIIHFSDLPNFHSICDVRTQCRVFMWQMDRWVWLLSCGSEHPSPLSPCISQAANRMKMLYLESTSGHFVSVLVSKSLWLTYSELWNLISSQLKLSPGPWS